MPQVLPPPLPGLARHEIVVTIDVPRGLGGARFAAEWLAEYAGMARGTFMPEDPEFDINVMGARPMKKGK